MRALRILLVICTAFAACLCFVAVGMVLSGESMTPRTQALMAAVLGVVTALDAAKGARKIWGGAS